MQIEEIALEFKGPLPECVVDEHRIPSHDDEVLKENEAVRCLQVLPQPKPDCNLNNISIDCCLIRKTYCMIQTSLYATLGHIPGKPSCGCCCWQRRQAFYRFPKPKYLLIYIYILTIDTKEQVKVFDYTVHFVQGMISRKMGTATILRRAEQGRDLCAALLCSGAILKCTNESLSNFTRLYRINIRKQSTKNFKIRALMKVDTLAQQCPPEALEKLEKKMTELDEKRNKKKSTEAEQEEEAEEAPRLDNRF